MANACSLIDATLELLSKNRVTTNLNIFDCTH